MIEKTYHSKGNDKQNCNRNRYSIEHILEIGHFHATIGRTQAMQIARVNRTTFERWERGETKAPAATLELLRLHAFGEPPSGMGNEWNGWIFKRGVLINYDRNMTFTPQELLAAECWRPLATQYIAENAALKTQIETYKAERMRLERVLKHKRYPSGQIIQKQATDVKKPLITAAFQHI